MYQRTATPTMHTIFGHDRFHFTFTIMKRVHATYLIGVSRWPDYQAKIVSATSNWCRLWWWMIQCLEPKSCLTCHACSTGMRIALYILILRKLLAFTGIRPHWMILETIAPIAPIAPPSQPPPPAATTTDLATISVATRYWHAPWPECLQKPRFCWKPQLTNHKLTLYNLVILPFAISPRWKKYHLIPRYTL